MPAEGSGEQRLRPAGAAGCSGTDVKCLPRAAGCVRRRQSRRALCRRRCAAAACCAAGSCALRRVVPGAGVGRTPAPTSGPLPPRLADAEEASASKRKKKKVKVGGGMRKTRGMIAEKAKGPKTFRWVCVGCGWEGSGWGLVVLGKEQHGPASKGGMLP